MKLTFFLIALALVFLRASLSWFGHTSQHGDNNGSISISNGDFHETIKWSGKIILSEDENSFASISPGGYIRLKQDDKKMLAESNLKGVIHYELYNGNEQLPLNDSGRNFISAAIKEMIAWGFNAQGRAERIYKKGGAKAVLQEIKQIKMDAVKFPYFELLFNNDSLEREDLLQAVKMITITGADVNRQYLLNRVSSLQRKDTAIAAAWIAAITHLDADVEKTGLLNKLIREDSLSDENFNSVVNIIAHLNADMDKRSIMEEILRKEPLPEDRWNKILDLSKHLNADMDKQSMFRLLTASKALTETQWISLVQFASDQNSDIDKANLLVLLTEKMPKTENTKAAYRQAAKKINNDADYGRAIKMLE